MATEEIKTEEAFVDEVWRQIRAGEWDDFIGQEKVKEGLSIAIEAAKRRNEPVEHVLLYGPPGLGKTTMAYLIAKAKGTNIKVTSGPAMERSGDLASILSNLEEGDVLFIDEIHRLGKTVEEMLYSAMEDFALDIVLGKGPGARAVRLDLNRFTLVGATTKIGKIAAPLRDRFGVIYRMSFYSDEELKEIVLRAAKRLGIVIDEAAAVELASRSRKTARIALKLLKRVRDFALVKAKGVIDSLVAKEALMMMEIDESGLEEIDRRMMKAIIEKHDGGPVGLETLAALVNEETTTIEDVYEPFLMQSGLLKRTNRGRVATDKAYSYLGLKRRTIS